MYLSWRKISLICFSRIHSYLLLATCAYGAHISNATIVNVHCNASQPDGCYITEPLDIHEANVLNFVDAGEWNNTLHLDIPSTSNVSVFPSGIFQRFQLLSELRIESGLKWIAKDDFKDADNLTILDIHNNNLHTLPANVFQYADGLVEISLSQNQLTTIEDYAFNKLNNLDVIYMQNNSLTVLKRNTFAGALKLRALQLENNRIESIEDGALNLPELKYIFLSHNRIQSLSDNVFRGAPKLASIALAANQLSHIGKSFQDCIQLTAVVLDHNHIDDIDLVAFEKLPKLLQLSLKNSGFRWRDVDQWPASPSAIIYLDISHNGLTGSDALTRLEYFSNLEELDLGENNFSELNGFANTKKKFPNLATLGLSGNLFICAKLRLVLNSLMSQEVTVLETVDIVGDVKNYKGVTCV